LSDKIKIKEMQTLLNRL